MDAHQSGLGFRYRHVAQLVKGEVPAGDRLGQGAKRADLGAGKAAGPQIRFLRAKQRFRR